MNLDAINNVSLSSLKQELGLIAKLSKRYHKYANIAAKGFVTKQEIINLKSILSGNALKGKLTKEEVIKLTDIHEYNGKPTQIVKIEQEHTNQGLNFLKGLYLTKGGKLKKNHNLEEIEVLDGPNDYEDMKNIIEDFKEFRYAGFEVDQHNSYNHYRNAYNYNPVWEVVSHSGFSFTYVQTFSGYWR